MKVRYLTIVRFRMVAALLLHVWSSETFAGSCPPEVPKDLTHVWGRGSGDSYSEAKYAALVDLSEMFGISIEAKATVTDDSDSDTHLGRKISATSKLVANGAEVHSQCSQDERHHVVVMLSKAKVKSAILGRAQQRQVTVEALLGPVKGQAANSFERKSLLVLRKELSSEKQDLNTWLVINGSRSGFPLLPSKLNDQVAARQGSVALRLFAASDDSVGHDTLNAVYGHLQSMDIQTTLTQNRDDSDIIWSCRVDKGPAIGANQRFKCTCELIGGAEAVAPVKVEGIAQASVLDGTASRLVINALRNGAQTD